jgi:outer membrane protein OmpA-like peptidoglycan-associated protein
MKAFPLMKIKLGGYTDSIVSDEANVKRSGETASSFMGELVKRGTDAKRIADLD